MSIIYIFLLFLLFNFTLCVQYIIIEKNHVNSENICTNTKNCEISKATDYDDSLAERIELDFDFIFYKKSYNRVFINPNGFIQTDIKVYFILFIRFLVMVKLVL